MGKAWSVEWLDKVNNVMYIGDFIPNSDADEIYSVAYQAVQSMGGKGLNGIAIYTHNKSRMMQLKSVPV